MKTILNIIAKDKALQVPANYLFSHSGYHFFIYRQVLQVYDNGTFDLSEKSWAVAEYTTGVALRQGLVKKAAIGECIDVINRQPVGRLNEAISAHEVLNFDIETVLSFVNKQVPPPAKKLVLGKYALDAAELLEAECGHNVKERGFAFKDAVLDVKRWVKFANEVVMLPGYSATLDMCERHDCDMIIITHDKGSYKIPNDDTGYLRRAMLEAFNVDGAGEHLRPVPVVKIKKPKAVKIKPVCEIETPAAIEFTEPAATSTWTTKRGLSIELPAGAIGENLSGITYEAPTQENRMYVDREGILWEYTPAWLINEIISTHNKKPKEHDKSKRHGHAYDRRCKTQPKLGDGGRINDKGGVRRTSYASICEQIRRNVIDD